MKKKQSIETADEQIDVKSAPKEIKKSGWEIKNRTYMLKGNKTPLTFTLASKHHSRTPLMWFDEEQGMSRELRYAINQNSPFVDEQKGLSTLSHIVFKDGMLFVPKVNQGLQKLLSLYHPQRNQTYYEVDEVAEATDDLVDLEMEIEALNMAKELPIDHAEAVLRVEQGSQVSSYKSAQIKRDILLFAKEQPQLFLELVKDDNVQLRNIAIKAVEANVINLDSEQRNFYWTSNKKKLMTVPFDENPYSAFAAFLRTDEGTEIFKSIEKKLK